MEMNWKNMQVLCKYYANIEQIQKQLFTCNGMTDLQILEIS